jgi:hypothetical protein
LNDSKRERRELSPAGDVIEGDTPRRRPWAGRSRAFRLFTIIALALALGTIGGLVILWPGHVTITTDLSVESYRANVERVEETICPGFMEQRCQHVTLRLQSGPDKGEKASLRCDRRARP